MSSTCSRITHLTTVDKPPVLSSPQGTCLEYAITSPTLFPSSCLVRGLSNQTYLSRLRSGMSILVQVLYHSSLDPYQDSFDILPISHFLYFLLTLTIPEASQYEPSGSVTSKTWSWPPSQVTYHFCRSNANQASSHLQQFTFSTLISLIGRQSANQAPLLQVQKNCLIICFNSLAEKAETKLLLVRNLLSQARSQDNIPVIYSCFTCISLYIQNWTILFHFFTTSLLNSAPFSSCFHVTELHGMRQVGVGFCLFCCSYGIVPFIEKIQSLFSVSTHVSLCFPPLPYYQC